MRYILERLKERSTYRGLALLGTLIGWSISPEQWLIIAQFGMSIGAVIDMFWPDKPPVKIIVPDSMAQVVVDQAKGNP